MDEPMAKVIWDFTLKEWLDVHLRGEDEYPTITAAKRAAELLDDCWGQGMHHVVVLNETKAERDARR